LEYIEKTCVKHTDVSLLAVGENQALFIPKVTRNTYIYPDSLLSIHCLAERFLKQLRKGSSACAIQVMLKSSVTNALVKPVAQCHARLAMSTEYAFQIRLPNKRVSTRATLNLTGINLQTVIRTGKRLHYIVQSNSFLRKNWHDVRRFCQQAFNAEPLTYSSEIELRDVTGRTIQGKLLFTSFHVSIQVMKYIFVETKPILTT